MLYHVCLINTSLNLMWTMSEHKCYDDAYAVCYTYRNGPHPICIVDTTTDVIMFRTDRVN